MDKDLNSNPNPNAPLHAKRGEAINNPQPPVQSGEPATPQNAPAPAPAQASDSAPQGGTPSVATNENQENKEEEIVPEWRNSPEWQAMIDARQEFVGAEYDYKEVKNTKGADQDEIDEAYEIAKNSCAEYMASKEAVKRKIADQILAGIDYSTLSPEEKKKIDSKIKLHIINELYSNEYRAYRKDQNEIEQSNVIRNAKEVLGSVLSNKFVKWYLGIKWYYRIPATTALLTVAGYGLGLAAVGTTVGSAGAFAGARIARGVSTFGVGTVVRGAIEKFGQKNEAERKEKLEKLASIDLNDMETIGAVQIVNNRHDRIQKWVKRAKVASAFGVAGLGMLASASVASGKTAESVAEHAASGQTPSSSSVVDVPPEVSKPQAPAVTDATPSAPPEVPPAPKVSDATEATTPAPDTASTLTKPREIETIASELPKKLVKTENYNPDLESGGGAESAKVAEGLFADPEIVKAEVETGGSTWKILENIMGENEKFKNLSGTAEEVIAKKTFVISNLTNDAIRNAEAIGLGEGGSLKVGDHLDFSKIFTDKAKINELLNKAESLSKPQMQNITDTNAKIADWVANPQNAGKALTNERVAEILSGKTETPPVVETPAPAINIDEKLGELDYKLGSSVLKGKFPEEVAKLTDELRKLEEAQAGLKSLGEGTNEYNESANHLKNQIEDVETQLSSLAKQLLIKDQKIVDASNEIDLARQNAKVLEEAQNFKYSGMGTKFLENKAYSSGELINMIAEMDNKINALRAERLSILDRGRYPSLDELKRATNITEQINSLMKERMEMDSRLFKLMTPRPEHIEEPRGVPPEPQAKGFSLNSADFERQLQEGFNQSIDAIYGKSGTFGLRRIAGVDTPEWQQIAHLPADKVLQYYESPKDPSISKELIEMLGQSTKHRKLIEGINSLKADISKNSASHDDLKPYTNGETIENFIRRLGAFRMKQSLK